MLKTIKFGGKILSGVKSVSVWKRLFLSEAYQCQEAWNSRFNSPILMKVKPTNMFFELEQRLNSTGKVSAVDVDIFANTVKEDYQLEEFLHLIHRLRLTKETSNTLDSTHHAVIRYLLNLKRYDDLIEILHDRLNYGIFPDHYCYNLLMDTFIKLNEFANAAKVAVLLMLQEDAEHPLSNALCVYSCHKYLENPDTWKLPEEKPEDDSEEVKVRVPYLRNPYFDDHFDLRDPRDLVGKTLAFQGRHRGDTIGRTCQLRGLILYKKYNAASELIKEWLNSNIPNVVYKEVFDFIEQDNSCIPEDQKTDHFANVEKLLLKLKQCSLHNGNLLQAIESDVKSAVNEYAEKDISQQHQTYIDWEKKRQEVLQAQIDELNRLARLKNVEQIKKDLEERETILTFFDKEEDIELQIQMKQEAEKAENERIYKIYRFAKSYRRMVAAGHIVPPEQIEEKK